MLTPKALGPRLALCSSPRTEQLLKPSPWLVLTELSVVAQGGMFWLFSSAGSPSLPHPSKSDLPLTDWHEAVPCPPPPLHSESGFLGGPRDPPQILGRPLPAAGRGGSSHRADSGTCRTAGCERRGAQTPAPGPGRRQPPSVGLPCSQGEGNGTPKNSALWPP